jgi:hypothetical protein
VVVGKDERLDDTGSQLLHGPLHASGASHPGEEPDPAAGQVLERKAADQKPVGEIVGSVA